MITGTAPIKFQGPVLFVQDIKISTGFYSQLLDQQVKHDFGACIAFTSGLSLWQRERASEIIFNDKMKISPKKETIWGELNFEVNDVPGLWKQVQANEHATIVHEIHEQPWGQLVFRLYDPDGHLIEVGEPIPVFVWRFHNQGLSVEAISERTSVAIEYVREIVEAPFD